MSDKREQTEDVTPGGAPQGSGWGSRPGGKDSDVCADTGPNRNTPDEASSLRAWLKSDGLIYSDDMIDCMSADLIESVVRWYRQQIRSSDVVIDD